MSMRLLSPKEGKSRQELDIQSQERRIVELDALINTKRIELDNLDRQLLKILSDNGAERYNEEEEWRSKISSLTEEVEQLEARRKRALVPLEEKEKELQDKDSALLKREEQIVIKESNLEYTKEALQDRLDAVSEREQDATDYAQKLNNREFAVQFQEQQIKERMVALTTIIKEAFEDMQRSQAESAKQKAILKGREVPLLERERNVEMREKSFADRERAITDKYQTLLRAITETNLKNNGNNNH